MKPKHSVHQITKLLDIEPLLIICFDHELGHHSAERQLSGQIIVESLNYFKDSTTFLIFGCPFTHFKVCGFITSPVVR